MGHRFRGWGVLTFIFKQRFQERMRDGWSIADAKLDCEYEQSALAISKPISVSVSDVGHNYDPKAPKGVATFVTSASLVISVSWNGTVFALVYPFAPGPVEFKDEYVVVGVLQSPWQATLGFVDEVLDRFMEICELSHHETLPTRANGRRISRIEGRSRRLRGLRAQPDAADAYEVAVVAGLIALLAIANDILGEESRWEVPLSVAAAGLFVFLISRAIVRLFVWPT